MTRPVGRRALAGLAWRDGQMVASYAGPVGYAGPEGPYFKFGIYRAPSAERLAVRHAGLQVGDAPLLP